MNVATTGDRHTHADKEQEIAATTYAEMRAMTSSAVDSSKGLEKAETLGGRRGSLVPSEGASKAILETL